MDRAIPIYLGDSASPLFGWVHPPRGGARHPLGIVICNTLGNESLRLHRSLRHLAERLAGAGFWALRFDFRGTGDSLDFEQVQGRERVSAWIEDIRSAIRELRTRAGVPSIGLFGVRLGATLALAAAAMEAESEGAPALESLVLWEPCLSGTDFISESARQHRVFESLLPRGSDLKRKDAADGGMEAMGFSMDGATVEALERLNPLAFSAKSANRVLLVGAAAPSGGLMAPRGSQPLLDHLSGGGATVEYRQCGGFQSIFRHLQRSEVAGPVHDLVLGWLSGNSRDTREGAGARHGTAPAAPRPAPPVPPAPPDRPFSETPVFFGPDRSLFGILTMPRGMEAGVALPAVIIVNAGVGTRIGPHRLYVEMARRWAALGYSVLRTDLSGSGDSPAPEGQPECDPYPASALADIARAMDFLENRLDCRRFIVAGVCSGADLAFRAASDDSRIACSLVINPRSFRARDFPDLELQVRAIRGRSQVRDRESWIQLLRMAVGEQGLRATLGKCLRVGASLFYRAAQGLGERLQTLGSTVRHPLPAEEVLQAFQRALDRGARILLFVSRGDPGVEYVDHHLGRKMRALASHPGFRRIDLAGADHLFTLQRARERVIGEITEYLRGAFPKGPQGTLIPWGPLMALVALAAPLTAWGSGLPPVFSRVLAAAFRDRSAYVSGNCGDNAYRLGERLAAVGADLSRVHVVFILGEERKVAPVPAYVRRRVLFPSRVRDPHAAWTFHVFLEAEGGGAPPSALDLDYRSVPVPIDVYFGRVFPPSSGETGSERLAHLFLRVIPWSEYAEAYRAHGGDEVASYYRSPVVVGHPIVTARDYLMHP